YVRFFHWGSMRGERDLCGGPCAEVGFGQKARVAGALLKHRSQLVGRRSRCFGKLLDAAIERGTVPALLGRKRNAVREEYPADPVGGVILRMQRLLKQSA